MNYYVKKLFFIPFLLIGSNILTTELPQSFHDFNDVRKKNASVFDMDDVFLKANKGNLAGYVLRFMPTNPLFSWKLIKAIKGNGDRDRGLSFRLADAVRGDKNLEQRYDAILTKLQQERRLVDGTIEAMKYAKDNGYAVLVATNRDRMSFEITAKHLGFDTLYK